MYGDFGNDNAQSLPRLQQEIQRGKIDAVLHVGDMAYDLATVSHSKVEILLPSLYFLRYSNQ